MNDIVSIGLFKDNKFILKYSCEIAFDNSVKKIIYKHFNDNNIEDILGVKINDIFSEGALQKNNMIFYSNLEYIYLITINFKPCYFPNGENIDWINGMISNEANQNNISFTDPTLYNKSIVKYLTYCYFDDLKLIKRKIFTFRTNDELIMIIKELWNDDYFCDNNISFDSLINKLLSDEYCIFIDKYYVACLSINFKRFYVWSRDYDPQIIEYDNSYNKNNKDIDAMTIDMTVLSRNRKEYLENPEYYKEKYEQFEAMNFIFKWKKHKNDN